MEILKLYSNINDLIIRKDLYYKMAKKPDVQKLKEKKSALVEEIICLRRRKAEINSILDKIYSGRPCEGESALKLANEIYDNNIKINRLRDKVDIINKKLQVKDVVSYTWVEGYID